MSKRENLFGSLLCQEVLAKEGGIHVLIYFLDYVLLVYLIVHIGVVTPTHVEV